MNSLQKNNGKDILTNIRGICKRVNYGKGSGTLGSRSGYSQTDPAEDHNRSGIYAFEKNISAKSIMYTHFIVCTYRKMQA